MNGQLNEQPLAELIREISTKSLSGRLRLEHEAIKIVIYFDKGNLLYAAANLRPLRVREYLQKSSLVSQEDLAPISDRISDAQLVKLLCGKGLLATTAAEQIQSRQVTDVLRVALLWTGGVWEFDSRSRLDESFNLKIDATSLLLEAGRRLPATFIASRFRNPAEMITPLDAPHVQQNLAPAEVFLLSRLDKPMPLRDLIAVSGVGETETVMLVYSLALAGLLHREHWKNAFREPQPAPPTAEPQKDTPTRTSIDMGVNEVENFLERLRKAQTHYDVLGVTGEVSPQSLKSTYYQIARRYHPDRFRKAEPSLIARLETAFAKITQAYDTLRDDNLRASYNSKLEARRKAEQLADSAPRASTPAPQPEPVAEGVSEPALSLAERAELQFKEGFAAFGLGQRKVALGLFASAASAVPTEPRYRAFYGHLLAADERTRRAAEAELHAAIKLDPANAEYRVMLAELYRDLGLKLRAKGEAERAVAADPNNRKARELLRTLK